MLEFTEHGPDILVTVARTTRRAVWFCVASLLAGVQILQHLV